MLMLMLMLMFILMFMLMLILDDIIGSSTLPGDQRPFVGH